MSRTITAVNETESRSSTKHQIAKGSATLGGGSYRDQNFLSHLHPHQLNNLAQELPLRILLAEDRSIDRMVASRILKSLGYQPDTVVNGVELLAALQKKHYDVVITDVQMPYMTGIEAARRICQQWNPQERPFIIALTSNTLPEERQACFDAGMDNHINKPLRVHTLIQALLKCFYDLA